MKMFKSKFHRIQLVMLLGMFALGRYFYDRLPEMITMRRNIDGVADRLERKGLISVFTLPALALVLVVIMKLAPFLDPRKEKYQQFFTVYESVQTILLWFLLYFYIVIIAKNLNPNLNIFSFFLFWIWILMMLFGNYLPKIRRNYFTGIKTPRTLDNETVWNKTHRLGWICFFWFGISLVINSYFLVFPLWHMGIILLITFFLTFYSYFISKHKD